MKNNFTYLLSKFFNTFLPLELNASVHTIRSYRNTFTQLLKYITEVKNIKIVNINFNIITRDLILDFLDYLEEKGNSINTRNQRLAGIKSFYQYVSTETIENIDNAKQILSIRTKKRLVKEMEYLTLEEYKEVIMSIDVSTIKGRRNYLLITLLYEGALRADEVRHIKVEDLRLQNNKILINGKGNKQRYIPIMASTVKLINEYMELFNITSGYLFNNNEKIYNETFIRDVINSVMDNTNINKHITPHSLRHSRAIHLLESGVDIMIIKDLLGHASVETTEIYAKVTDKLKDKSIKEANKLFEQPDLPDWSDDNDILSLIMSYY